MRTEATISAETERAGIAALLVELDRSFQRRVLVFGSLPPEGRDLDLLVPLSEIRALTTRLAALGFESKGHQWARFLNGEADVVEVVPVDEWRLPAGEVDALFETGTPLAGIRWLVRPAAPYAALILARKFIRARARELDRKTRERIDSLVREDPHVWASAAERAQEWGLQRALECLRQAYSERAKITRLDRARAHSELLAASGRAPLRAHARALASLLPRPRRGALVTLSGLDGAGKSSQAAALHRTLVTLGHRPAREWAPLGGTRSALTVVALGRPILRRAMGRPADGTARLGVGHIDGEAPRRAGAAGALRALWVTILVSFNAAAHVRAKVRYAGRGRTLIFDRYVLDSAVQLHHNYGDTRVVRSSIRLLKVLSPKAERAFLLDVSSETARRRKDDLWNIEQLQRRARLYRDWHESFGVVRLDGEQPAEDLADEIARDVWRSLGKPR